MLNSYRRGTRYPTTNRVASLRPPGRNHWNRRPGSRGMRGRLRVESLAGCRGIRNLCLSGPPRQYNDGSHPQLPVSNTPTTILIVPTLQRLEADERERPDASRPTHDPSNASTPPHRWHRRPVFERWRCVELGPATRESSEAPSHPMTLTHI